MKKRKNIAIPMILAATIAAVSVPCSSQIVMASDTYQVGVIIRWRSALQSSGA